MLALLRSAYQILHAFLQFPMSARAGLIQLLHDISLQQEVCGAPHLAPFVLLSEGLAF
jgi:hypothetical protein